MYYTTLNTLLAIVPNPLHIVTLPISRMKYDQT